MVKDLVSESCSTSTDNFIEEEIITETIAEELPIENTLTSASKLAEIDKIEQVFKFSSVL